MMLMMVAPLPLKQTWFAFLTLGLSSSFFVLQVTEFGCVVNSVAYLFPNSVGFKCANRNSSQKSTFIC